MWIFLTTFLNFAIVQVFRAALIKFVVLTAILAVIVGLALLLINYLVDLDFMGVSNLFNALPPGLWWFFHVFQLHIGLPLMLGAMATRFAIRRIPVIG